MCPPQWRDMLPALAVELGKALDRHTLRAVMFRTGMRYAAAHPLPECQTIEALTTAINTHLGAVDWGYLECYEHEGHLELLHFAAPLLYAFGEQSTWAMPLLEGIYHYWFTASGMPSGLQVTAQPPLAAHTLRLTVSAIPQPTYRQDASSSPEGGP